MATMSGSSQFGIGTISLVGAGPGDPELITMRGLKRLRTSDVVAYDRLVHPVLLDEVPEYAERVDVGKRASGGVDQETIHRLMIDRAYQGKQVVRLKGGDPFVFGRGGEEMAALLEAGVPVEIVPGITSAVAVPGLAGIPLTHRDYSSSVTIVTGHEDPAKPNETVDWDALGGHSGTIVILMGIGRVKEISDRLIDAGRPVNTPSAVIASGSLPEQRSVKTPLGDLPRAVADNGIKPPAVIIVGDVVRLSPFLEPSYAHLISTETARSRIALTLND